MTDTGINLGRPARRGDPCHMLTGHASAAARRNGSLSGWPSGGSSRLPHQAAGLGPDLFPIERNTMVLVGKGRGRAGSALVIRSSQSAGFVAGAKPVHIYRPPGRPLIERHAMTDAKTDAKSERPHVAARQNRLREALRANLKRRKFQARSRADQSSEPAGAADSANDIDETRSDRMDQDGHD